MSIFLALRHSRFTCSTQISLQRIDLSEPKMLGVVADWKNIRVWLLKVLIQVTQHSSDYAPGHV